MKIYKRSFFVSAIFLAGLLINFGALTEWLPHADSLYYGFYFRNASQYAVENALGRFGNVFLAHFKGMYLFPIFDTVLSLFLISFSSYFIIRLFAVKNMLICCLFGILFIGTPCFSATFAYYYCSDSYMLALLCSVLAVYVLEKGGRLWRIPVAVGMITLALTIYQAYLFVTIGLCALMLVKKLSDEGQKWHDIILKAVEYLISGGLGAVCYIILFNYIQKRWAFQAMAERGMDSMGRIHITDIPLLLQKTYKEFFAYYFTNRYVCNGTVEMEAVHIVLLALCTFGIVWIFFKKKIKIGRSLFSLGIMLVYPIALMGIAIVSGDNPIYILMYPTTALLYLLPLLLLDDEEISEKKKIHIVVVTGLTICFCIVGISQIKTVRTWERGKREQIKRHYEVAKESVEEIQKLQEGNSYPVMFDGSVEGSYLIYHGTYVETIGWLGVIRHFIGMDYAMSAEEDMNRIVEGKEFASMPSFPNEGYVKLIEGNIVVKLQD